MKKTNSAPPGLSKAIKAAMKQRGIAAPKDLTEALGLEPRQRAMVYNWIKGANGVSGEHRAKVAKVLGLDEAELFKPVGVDGRAIGPARRAVALVEHAKANGSVIIPPASVSDVFTIRVRSDGSMTLKLDATMPFARGIQLAQHLLTFGLVAGSEAE